MDRELIKEKVKGYMIKYLLGPIPFQVDPLDDDRGLLGYLAEHCKHHDGLLLFCRQLDIEFGTNFNDGTDSYAPSNMQEENWQTLNTFVDFVQRCQQRQGLED